MGEADELAWETLASETDCIWAPAPLFVGGVTGVLQPEPLDPPNLETH